MCGRPRGPSADGLGSQCRRKLATRHTPNPTPRTIPTAPAAGQLPLEDTVPTQTAAQWNDRYPVGTPVVAFPGFRPEDDPKGERLVTRTRTRAETLGGHTPVVWVDGHSACIDLAHVDFNPDGLADDDPDTCPACDTAPLERCVGCGSCRCDTHEDCVRPA